MRLGLALCVVAIAGCRRAPPTRVQTAPTSSFTLAPFEPEVEPFAPVAPLKRPPRRLKLVSKPLQGFWAPQQCSVVDEDTGEVVGRASNKETAAGGSEVECVGFEAEGHVIIFMNSRGQYAKDARLGKTNDRSLPCGDGRWASDLSSCIEVDTSPFAYSGADEKEDAPFDVKMCPIGRGQDCPVLATIKRGLNRAPYSSTRSWDAVYCDDKSAAVVANGELRLVAAPSGKVIARQPTPRMTRVGCSDGELTVSGGKTKLRFRVSGSVNGKTLEKIET